MRVLVVGPDRWRELGICRALESETGLHPVAASDLGDRTFSRIDAPTVVLLAEEAARTDPRRSLTRLRSKFPEAKVLVIGDSADPADAADLICDGASGYFSLSLGEDRLLKAIRVVAQGGIWTSERGVAALVQRVRGVSTVPQNLSESEMALLRMLHEGLSNKEMAQQLGVAEVTVKTRLGALYRRYGVKTRVQLLAYAFRARILRKQ